MSPSSNLARRLKAAAFVLLAAISVALAAVNLGYGPERAQALLRQDETPRQDEKPKRDLDQTRLVKPDMGRIEAPKPVPATMVNAAYRGVAAELPGISPESVTDAHQSVIDPSWSSVRVGVPDGDGYYAIFLRREGKSWSPRRSVLVEPDSVNPDTVKSVLDGIPQDLSDTLYLPPEISAPEDDLGEQAVAVIKQSTDGEGEWSAGSVKSKNPYHVIEVKNEEQKDLSTKVYLSSEDGLWRVVAIGRDLTSTEARGFPKALVKQTEIYPEQSAQVESTDPVLSGDVEREKIEPALEKAREEIEDYPGIAGFYVMDLKNGSGYGIRPDEEFFTASVIKVPVMIAVYRRIDEGKLSLDDTFEVTEEDMASGSGGLQWEGPGTPQTVEDFMWLMITQSDNVATNTLIRIVGGRDYVNEVSRSLGAQNTILHRKVSSERAAVPSLDNETTPRDMATLLSKIYKGEAAKDESCEEMVEFLRQNERELWMEAGVPPEVPVANKGGWLDSTYNDAGIVEHEDHPYVFSAFTKYGSDDLNVGGNFLAQVSEDVWMAQSGETLDTDEKERAEVNE